MRNVMRAHAPSCGEVDVLHTTRFLKTAKKGVENQEKKQFFKDPRDFFEKREKVEIQKIFFKDPSDC